MGRHLTRWLIPLPAILFAVFPQNANAEPIAGLNAIGYTIDEIPPIRSDDTYTVCHSETENNINRNFNGEPFGSCPNDMFMVHYTGFIEIPANNTIRFMVAADDGGTIKIGLTEFGTWNDKGCSWSAQTTESFPAGSYPLDGWFYEHGGGTCFILAWNINNTGWTIVPDSAFTTNATQSTTTTVETTSTTTSTTTTEPSTTTTSSTTTLPISTTTTTEPVQSSTTTSTADTTTTTTTTTSTTVPPTTTTTEAPYTPPQTTTTTPTIEPQPAPTTPVTETTVAEPETTTTETSTTVPDETFPEPVEPDQTTIPETTVPVPTTEPAPDETEQPTEPLEPSEYISETTVEQVENSSPTTLPETVIDIPADEPVTDKQLEEILDTLTEAAPEQIVAAITQVLSANITSDQATEIASTPEVLAAITDTQAEQLFEQIKVEELTEQQLEAFTEAIQQAPTKIKKAFEKTINIFGSQFENYVPTGSNIPVKTRRTLVAAGALIATIPSTRVRR